MAIKKVQAKSGKMYDADSPQGRTIVASATVGQDADFDSSSSTLGADAGMADTLQLIYGETQESSDSLDNIEEALVDDGRETTEERNKRLEKSDKKPNKFLKALGAGKDKIGSGLSKVKGSLSGKFGLLLLGGALVLLNKYSDELAGPDGILTKFLEYLKKQLIPDITALYEDLKVWWDKGWKKVNQFFTYMGNVFKSIGDYVDTFDTDGVPGLSPKEKDALLTDLKTKASSFISSMLIGMLSSVGSAIFTGALLVSGISLAKSALLSSGLFAATGTIPAATAATGGAVTALKAMKVGVGGYLAIGLMVAGGVAAMYDASTRAATASIDEGIKKGQKGDWTAWTASFLAGGEGGWDNAFANTKEKGMMGAGIGSLLGVPFGPAGMLLGGMIGALAGGLFGAVTGKIGAPKMQKAFEGIESVIDETGDSIFAHFNGIAQAVLALIPGSGTTVSEAYLKGTSIVQKRNLKNRGEVLSAIASAEAGNISFSGAMNLSEMEMATGKASKENIALELAFLQEKLAKIDKQIVMSPGYAHSEAKFKQMSIVESLQDSMNLNDLKRELVENPFERFAKAQKMLATAPRLPDGMVQTKGRYKGSTLDIKALIDRGDGAKLDFLFDADMGQEVFFQRQYPEYAARPDVNTAAGAFEIYRNFAENTKILDAEKAKLAEMNKTSEKGLIARGQGMLNKVNLMEELIKENPTQYKRENGIVMPIAPDLSSVNTSNYANFTSQMSARSDFWVNYDTVAAAVK